MASHRSSRNFRKSVRLGFSKVTSFCAQSACVSSSIFSRSSWISQGSRDWYCSPKTSSCRTTSSEVVTSFWRLPAVASDTTGWSRNSFTSANTVYFFWSYFLSSLSHASG
uniref:(northern house mosquito) hypothetical protein n=1 Tax=Culex pipiens TaxID=7175 RepID=A0A8D8IY26_CULPI